MINNYKAQVKMDNSVKKSLVLSSDLIIDLIHLRVPALPQRSENIDLLTIHLVFQNRQSITDLKYFLTMTMKALIKLLLLQLLFSV